VTFAVTFVGVHRARPGNRGERPNVIERAAATIRHPCHKLTK
jgi:hypothetical protein